MPSSRMHLGARLITLCAFAVAAWACDPGSEATPSSDRQPIGKADAASGSCGSPALNTCGDAAEGGKCWCDDLCEQVGDCCADKVAMCGAQDVRPCHALELNNNPDDETECIERAECRPFIHADGPAAQGGALICIGVIPDGAPPEPELVPCAELEPNGNPVDAAECEARDDCIPFLVADGPAAQGGTIVCVSVEPDGEPD